MSGPLSPGSGRRPVRLKDERPASRYHCPESVTSHSQGRDGRCLWCEFKVGRGAVMPDRFGESELSVAYRRAYDPDWGSGRHDVDP